MRMIGKRDGSVQQYCEAQMFMAVHTNQASQAEQKHHVVLPANIELFIAGGKWFISLRTDGVNETH